MGVARRAVLTNLPAQSKNPWIDLWRASLARAGADERPLGLRAVVALPSSSWVALSWPEAVLRSPRGLAELRVARLLALIALARSKRMRVLLTAHNTRSHDPRFPWLDRMLSKTLDRFVTDVHLMSAAGAPEYLVEHPGLAGAVQHVIPHGTYRPTLPAPVGAAAARAAVGLPADAQVLLAFGQIRGYKGIADFVDHLEALPAGWRLVVVGAVKEAEVEADLRAAAARHPERLSVQLSHVTHEVLCRYLEAADAVVLPYQRVLNSGSALLALSVGRPVHVPTTPTFVELQQRCGPAWVHLYDGPPTPAALALEETPTEGPDLGWCEWSTIDALLAELLSSSDREPPADRVGPARRP
jgi:glycosyltransferase involved in cell wall biosynthesis